MKVCFVMATPDMSGGNRVIAAHAAALVARGHEVVIVHPPYEPERVPALRRWLRWVLGRTRPLRSAPVCTYLIDANLDVRPLSSRRLVTDADVPDGDAVIATWWETAEWVAALSNSKGTKLYFVQHHEVWPPLPEERCRATYRLPLKKIVVAQWLHDVMANEYDDANSALVTNAVDHAQFYAPPRERQPDPTVGFIFSGQAWKGTSMALAAIALIRQKLPQLRVIAFGSHALDDPKRLEGIQVTVDPPQAKLRDLYAQCDVWLSASDSEGFGLPVLEAMACRTPVVSTRTGWAADGIVHRVNGALVEPRDASAMAFEALRILELPPEAWRDLSQAAYSSVAGLHWDDSTRAFEQVLVEAAAGRLPSIRVLTPSNEHRAHRGEPA
jgi:glycosyltransferase involved in cell wall biosynthesis